MTWKLWTKFETQTFTNRPTAKHAADWPCICWFQYNFISWWFNKRSTQHTKQ